MRQKIFTVEFDQVLELVELHLDQNGLDDLMEVLSILKEKGSRDHFHLMTENWGGNSLTGEKQNKDSNVKLINHLKICLWPSDQDGQW